MPDKIGVHIPGAVTVNSQRYLEALWATCQELIAGRRGGGGGGGGNACLQEDTDAVDPGSTPGAGPPANSGVALESSRAAHGSFLRLVQRTVTSVEEVEGGGDCDAVIVACGAAAAAIAEVPHALDSHMDLAHVRPLLCCALQTAACPSSGRSMFTHTQRGYHMKP